ncbi:hypothetical protein [Candidatus Palauibacter sp.]|uniref:hypothetical protein n=1 Tax=Candidatus Palauibacter sp. TaxID=3101350 RepID=UPI003B5908EC
MNFRATVFMVWLGSTAMLASSCESRREVPSRVWLDSVRAALAERRMDSVKSALPTQRQISPPTASPTRDTSRSTTTVLSQGLSETSRKLAFLLLVRCQDNGTGNAHDVACMRQVERTYGINRTQLNRIINEGISKRWPPL